MSNITWINRWPSPGYVHICCDQWHGPDFFTLRKKSPLHLFMNGCTNQCGDWPRRVRSREELGFQFVSLSRLLLRLMVSLHFSSAILANPFHHHHLKMSVKDLSVEHLWRLNNLLILSQLTASWWKPCDHLTFVFYWFKHWGFEDLCLS